MGVPANILYTFLLLLSLLSYFPPLFLHPRPRSWRSAPGEWSPILLSLPNTGVEWRCTATPSATDVHKPNREWQVSLGPLRLPPSLIFSSFSFPSSFFSHHASPPLSFCVDLWFIVPCRVSRSLLTRAKLGPGGCRSAYLPKSHHRRCSWSQSSFCQWKS